MLFLQGERDVDAFVFHLSCGQCNLEDGGVRFWHGQVPEQYMAILLLVLCLPPRRRIFLYIWACGHLLGNLEQSQSGYLRGKKVTDSFRSNLLCMWFHVLLGRYDDWRRSGGDGAGGQDAQGQRIKHDEDLCGLRREGIGLI